MSLIATVVGISIVYFIVKFVEYRMTPESARPIKYIFKDSIIVAFSTWVALTAQSYLPQSASHASPIVFTEDPNF
jgi:hypothetical protein